MAVNVSTNSSPSLAGENRHRARWTVCQMSPLRYALLARNPTGGKT
jgi:hypothetical protein